ncbi:serine/threonine acetyltransferase [Xanthomonas nasturtii]|uniref:Serine/threonine acetyltransferase n=1 Tax=Xanthomonas nasturtii TaxID=1843581 RepID=A0A3E1KL70_9XANT|nr:YopJ family type III secretion system effector XopJ [Xanthomonas nasturtii]MCL1499197.1 serine/threonine acetyltransferase [Xanthomonas nasturtii]MCL1502948.1 serine/threonine acetyltransferase [Xanthomonas nasturtii]MCL1523044.1 serine/threonine acetyltransferase [Xanthomonas nasturtii]MCL1527680.1 serine/threonine acetyltransferase [Xanthomonas nasturtii]MCL1529073.1 serine/threonine acetyltransferase [Xanthomonas nasturtii]
MRVQIQIHTSDGGKMKKFFRSLGVGGSSSSRFQPHIPEADSAPSSKASTPPSSPPPDSPPSNSAFSALPARPRKKAEALSDAVQSRGHSAPSSLVSYANATLDQLRRNEPISESLRLMDIENLPHLVRSYDNRLKNLNLRSFDTPGEFLHELGRWHKTGLPLRAVVRLDEDPRRWHRVAFDVRNHENGHTTIIALEPASAYNPDHMPGFVKIRENLTSQFGKKISFSVIEAEALKSIGGCVIFSLDYALAAYQERSTFDRWHKDLRKKGNIMGMTPESEYLDDLGVYLLRGTRLLPANFYKHAHSRRSIDELEAYQPGASATDVRSGRAAVYKESLSRRLEEFRVERDKSYSMSIEASRARKIRHALES